MHQSAVAGSHAIGRELLRVGRPNDGVELVAVGLGPIGAEHREGPGAGFAHGDVEVRDDGVPLAVRRRAGLRVRTGRRAGGRRLPLFERADDRRLGAGVVCQRARPGRVVEARLNRALVVLEGERVEGERRRRDLPSRHLRERRGKLLVIERRALLAGVGVDEHELVAALHRSPVPEAVRLLDPGGRPGHVERQRFVLLAQRRRALVVGGRDLRGGRQRKSADDEAGQQSRSAERFEHVADSTRNRSSA